MLFWTLSLECHKFTLRPEGGSRGKKCPILIFQYVIELEKTNKMQKKPTFCRFRKRKCKPQHFRNGGFNQKSPHQIPGSLSKEHTCQVSDHSYKPVLQEVAQKLKKQSRDKAV